jgi:ABC-type lipoprotein release transport system permease subunit
MNKLVFANLIHRPMRSIISAAAIAIEVVMIISVAAIFLGQIDGQKIRTNGIGADMIVRPPNASAINAVSGAPIPARNVEALRKLPHVAVASPAIQTFTLGGGVPEIIFGIDYQSYNALLPFVFIEGGPFQGPNDVIVDDVFSRTDKGYKVGDTIKILSTTRSASAASSKAAKVAANLSASTPSVNSWAPKAKPPSSTSRATARRIRKPSGKKFSRHPVSRPTRSPPCTSGSRR